ncbi:heavy metal sensor histidine kinase [Vibrio sp. RC27]
MRLKRSLTLRLTCLFSASAIITIFLLSLFLHNEMSNYFIAEDTHTLRTKALRIKDIIGKNNFNKEFSNIISKMESVEGVAIKVDNKDKQIVLYTSDKIHFPEDILNKQLENAVDYNTDSIVPDFRTHQNTPPPPVESLQDELFEWSDGGSLYRGIQFYFSINDPKTHAVLITLAMNIDHRVNFLDHFQSVLIKFATIAGLLSALLYGFVTYYGLQPLKKLSVKAQLVSAKDIKQRMPVDDLPIEIAGLSETLNNMLERLEDAFKQLENFSSDIAHELRTPINKLMMQTQVVLSKPRQKQEYIVALGTNIEEFERLARMISDMLFLAKADNKQILLSPESIHLDQEINDLFEFYEALAEDRNISLKLEGEAEIDGDKLMLRRAFSNLLSNAINHCFEASEIKVKIYKRNKRTILEFINSGNTIPKDVLPHLFTRFYRADEARTDSSQEGVGLGLAITQSIAQAHGGHVTVHSEENTTTFIFAIDHEV